MATSALRSEILVGGQQVKNKYDSRSLIDFSESMTDVGHFLSFAKSGNWATTSLRRDSRPRTAPNNRKPRARSSSNGRTAAQRENPHSTSLSHSNIIKREPNSNQRRPSSAQPSDPADEASATKPQHRLLQPEPETDSHFSYSYSASKPSREVGSESEASAELVSPRGHESLSQGTQQRRLTARQQELKSRIEREQAKEHSRQAALKVVTDPKERDRLMRIFSLEREEAKRAILALSYA